MEKKNTVLLTVIAVATLLVAVVGATFAYFTASIAGTSKNTATDVSTRNEVGGVDLSLKTAAATGSNVQYPGGYVVNGATVTAKSLGTDNYTVDYTLNGTITNNTDTALTYKVYQVNTAITGAAVSGCTMRQYQQGSELRYTYYNADNSASTCTVSSSITGGKVVATGTVDAKSGDTAGSETISISSGDQTTMKLTSTSAGASTYYYLVVEYPDTKATQSATGASIVANLTSVSDAQAKVA